MGMAWGRFFTSWITWWLMKVFQLATSLLTSPHAVFFAYLPSRAFLSASSFCYYSALNWRSSWRLDWVVSSRNVNVNMNSTPSFPLSISASKSRDLYHILMFFESENVNHFSNFEVCLICKHWCRLRVLLLLSWHVLNQNRVLIFITDNHEMMLRPNEQIYIDRNMSMYR